MHILHLKSSWQKLKLNVLLLLSSQVKNDKFGNKTKNKDSPLDIRQQKSDYQVTTDLKAKRNHENMQKGSVFFPA